MLYYLHNPQLDDIIAQHLSDFAQTGKSLSNSSYNMRSQ